MIGAQVYFGRRAPCGQNRTMNDSPCKTPGKTPAQASRQKPSGPSGRPRPARAPAPDDGDGASAQEKIRRFAAGIGLAEMRVTQPHLSASVRSNLRRFVSEKAYLDMHWMADKLERRLFPLSLLPGTRSVLVFGLSYAPSAPPLRFLHRPSRGLISVYAQGKDYHRLMLKRLRQVGVFIQSNWPASELRLFVDTAPVAEKPLAQQAGLGWQGKHTNLVSRTHGSWLFLGSLFTTLALPPDPPQGQLCGSCRLCLTACPTAALATPYRLNVAECLAYYTIEHKGAIPMHLRRAMSNRVFGCDDCLAVCPWNKFAQATRETDFKTRFSSYHLRDFLSLDEASFRDVFRQTPVRRLGHRLFLRNCLIAAGNSRDRTLLARLRVFARDPDPLLAEHATWAVRELEEEASSDA